MLKINKDMTVEFEEDVQAEDIVNLMISFYNGQLSTNMASKIQVKDKAFIKKLESVFYDVLFNRFEEEYRNLFISMNKPFFNQLGIGRISPPPYISPLVAFRKK
jgi:hypothetical protein